jgi:hypothetical protein
MGVADTDEPRSARNSVYPMEKLRFGEYRSTAKRKILFDNVRRKLGTKATELSEPLMMSTDHPKVSGTLSVCASGQGIQPCGLILLSDTLWHWSQILRVHPAIAVDQGSYGVALIFSPDRSGTKHFHCLSVNDSRDCPRQHTFRASDR